MPADRRCLGGLQPHKTLDEEHAFFAVSVGKGVLNGVIGNLFPLSGLLVFHIAGTHLIELRLADIVQQGTQRKALRVVTGGVKVLFHHHLIDVHTVLYQTAGTGAVVAGAGGRSEKVSGLQPFQQTVGALAADIALVIFNEFLLIVHAAAPFRVSFFRFYHSIRRHGCAISFPVSFSGSRSVSGIFFRRAA